MSLENYCERTDQVLFSCLDLGLVFNESVGQDSPFVVVKFEKSAADMEFLLCSAEILDLKDTRLERSYDRCVIEKYLKRSHHSWRGEIFDIPVEDDLLRSYDLKMYRLCVVLCDAVCLVFTTIFA